MATTSRASSSSRAAGGPEGLAIRPAAAADAAALARLAGELGYPTVAAEALERLAGLLVAGAGTVYVAEAEGEALGWVHVFVARRLESAPFAEIGGLVVAQGARGRGVGSALLLRAERWAREAGFETLRVRSNVLRRRARGFYQREGYALVKQQNVFEKRLEARPAGSAEEAPGAVRDEGD